MQLGSNDERRSYGGDHDTVAARADYESQGSGQSGDGRSPEENARERSDAPVAPRRADYSPEGV